VSEVVALLVVASLVYFSDAVWWIKPDRIVVYGSKKRRWLAYLGPHVPLRGESGLFVPRLTPPFNTQFEVDATAAGTLRLKEAEIRATAERALATTTPLNQLGTVFWAYCFVAAPLLLVTLGLRRVWLVLVIGLFANAIVIVAMFARAWRRLYPSDPTGWRNEAVPMVLSPPAAIRAADTLTRRLFAAVNGLAVVKALATPDDFVRIARLYYYDTDRNAALEAMLAKDLEQAVQSPPQRDGVEMEGYCPRCHTQLARLDGACPECLHVEIVSFEATMPSDAPCGTFQSTARR
jgi:hypothetical protein